MRLEIASRKAVKYACENFHYSKIAAPRAYDFALSIFNNKNEWCGCICYGKGANNNLLSPYGLTQGQGAELIRVALNGKQENVSKALSISLKIFKKKNPLSKLIVSYADIDQEHFGIIYQATNWYYVGKYNENSRGAFIIKGKKVHGKTVHGKSIGQNINEIRNHLDPNATEFITKGKHKYLYPLSDDMKELCEKLKKPYPKRVKTIESDGTPFQEEEGGANPTLTHQFKQSENSHAIKT